MEPIGLLNVAGNLTAVGFVIWLTHRLTTRTIPDMTDAYLRASEKQRDDFRESLKAQRDDFADFHNREHQTHESRLQSVMDKCLQTGSGDPK